MTIIRILFISIAICITTPYSWAQITIRGDIPTEYKLIKSLLDDPISEYHKAWLTPIHDVLSSQHEIRCPGEHTICALDEDDINGFLRVALKKYFSYSITQQDIKAYFQQKTLFIKPSNDNDTQYLYLKDDDIMLQIIQAAKKLLDITKDGTAILLGQSPSLIAASMLKIDELNNGSNKIIPIAFSGHPDLIMSERNKNTWVQAAKNILTRKRELAYRDYLYKQGIGPYFLSNKDKVYIIDYSTGPSISAFLLFLARWYNETSHNLPDIVFINLLASKDKHYCREGTWEKDTNPKVNLHISTSFNMSIDTIYLDMDKFFLDKLVETKSNARTIISNYSINWDQPLPEINSPIGKRLIRIYENKIKKMHISVRL